MEPAAFPIILLGAALAVLLVVWPVWRIATKMGLPGFVGLLVFVPGVNILLAWVLALKEWPIERKLRRRSAKPSTAAAPVSNLVHPVHRMKAD